MSLTMPENAGSFEIAPIGNHVAVCCRVLDLGTQKATYQGEEKRQRKIYIEWMISGEQKQDGEAFYVGERYTFSSHEKATLRKHLEAWRAKKFEDSDFGEGGFQIKNILGKPCMIQVVHADGYANIANISSLPKSVGIATIEKPGALVFLSLESDEFDSNVFDSLSDKLQETIGASPEYCAVTGSEPRADREIIEDSNDVPF